MQQTQPGTPGADCKYLDRQPQRPPQPPPLRRRLNLYRFQWVGLALLAVIVLLAVLNVFGEAFDTVAASNARLDVQVDYPARYRYKMLNSLTVTITNRSDATLNTLSVEFERSYIEAFSTVTFEPALKTITGTAYRVELTGIAPGETRVVTVELQAERYGQHAGRITLSPENGDTLELSVTTLVFP